MFITSKGTIDKLDGALREYVSSQADLLGAIRLPNDAFKKNANTEVTTDIVMLRKRCPAKCPPARPGRKSTAITNSIGESIHRQRILRGPSGNDARRDAARRPDVWRDEPTLEGNGRDLAEALAQAIALLPQDVSAAAAHKVAQPTLGANHSRAGSRQTQRLLPAERPDRHPGGDVLHLLTGLSTSRRARASAA